MARLIDADALLQAIKKADEADPDLATCWSRGSIRRIIEGLPTIEAAPVVHGRWDDFCNGKMCCCSACKAEFDNACNEIHGEWKFCPNCGAKMDGGVSDG